MKFYSLFIIAGLPFFSGCRIEKENEKAVEQAIQISEGGKNTILNVSLRPEDSLKTLLLPSDFPKDVFVYPNALVKGFSRTSSKVSVKLESSDDIDKVLDTFTEKMTGLGWKMQSIMKTEDGSILFLKKEKRNVIITISYRENRIGIELNVLSDG